MLIDGSNNVFDRFEVLAEQRFDLARDGLPLLMFQLQNGENRLRIELHVLCQFLKGRCLL